MPDAGRPRPRSWSWTRTAPSTPSSSPWRAPTCATGGLGGVGGTFRGGPGGGLVGTFQRNEYARYERDVRRLRGKALVLTGTASVFPVSVLREVVAARRDGACPTGRAPGRSTTCGS